MTRPISFLAILFAMLSALLILAGQWPDREFRESVTVAG